MEPQTLRDRDHNDSDPNPEYARQIENLQHENAALTRQQAGNATTVSSTTMWRGFVLLFISLLSFLSTWMFNTLTALPKEYVNKSDFTCAVAQITGTINDRFKRLDERLDQTNQYLLTDSNRRNR